MPGVREELFAGGLDEEDQKKYITATLPTERKLRTQLEISRRR